MAEHYIIDGKEHVYESADEKHHIKKNITLNGTYKAESEPGDVTGYSEVDVNVEGGGSATLITKNITENGTYNASSDNADGYSSVVVDVAGSSSDGIIHTGTGNPSQNLGSNGHIYIKYDDEEVIPNEYTKLDFIEANGTQCIDTGVPARVQLKAEIDYQFTSNYPNIQGILAGSSNRNTNCIYLVANWESYFVSATLGYANKYVDKHDKLDFDRHLYVASLESGNVDVSLDGTSIHSEAITLSDTTSTTNLYIFSYSTGENKAKCKLFGLKIYDYLDNGNIIRNFVPVKRKADDEVGLYDIVNGTFYTNVGTGDFIAGNEIGNKDIVDVFLKVNGIWKKIEGQDVDNIDFTDAMVLSNILITQNGIYNASSDNADGYSSVTVNVPEGNALLLNEYKYNNTTGSSIRTTIDETIIIPKDGRYYVLACGFANQVVVEINNVSQSLNMVDSNCYARYYGEFLDLHKDDTVHIYIDSTGKSAEVAQVISIDTSNL